MLAELTASLGVLLQTYGAIGVFTASIIEELIAPIPSTAVVLFGGFAIVPQDAPLSEALLLIALKIMLPASAGIALGSLFPYYVARYGGEFAVRRFGTLLCVDFDTLRKAQTYFEKNHSDEVILFIARAIPFFPSAVIGVLCGLIRMPVWEFLLWSFLGNLIRTFILGFIGWWAGATYAEYAHQFSVVEKVVMILTGVVLIGAFLFYRRWYKKRKKFLGMQ